MFFLIETKKSINLLIKKLFTQYKWLINEDMFNDDDRKLFCQISEDMINNVVNPLIFDIIKYRLTTNFSNDGAVSSMKEGDVSVNYDTNSSLGNLIQGRIKDLKNYYSIRIRMV